MHAMIGFLARRDKYDSPRCSMALGVKTWLSSLEGCGVDLYVYGKREEELQEKAQVRHEFRLNRSKWDRAAGTLRSFTYGSSPSEWDVKTNYYCWDPTEDSDSDQDSDQDCSQVEEMPGAWIEP